MHTIRVNVQNKPHEPGEATWKAGHAHGQRDEHTPRSPCHPGQPQLRTPRPTERPAEPHLSDAQQKLSLRAEEMTISGELAAPVDAHVEVGQTSRQERPPAPRRREHRLDRGQSMRHKAAVNGSEGQQGHTMGPGAHLDRHVGRPGR
jgi:hypothetical protein